jgi:hypothetical protein
VNYARRHGAVRREATKRRGSGANCSGEG